MTPTDGKENWPVNAMDELSRITSRETAELVIGKLRTEVRAWRIQAEVRDEQCIDLKRRLETESEQKWSARKRVKVAEDAFAHTYDILERLVADLETNTESGAPEYAHAALAHLAPFAKETL